jgi:hypothetical protein
MGTFLVGALHHRPRGVLGVGVGEHRLLGVGVRPPFVQRREVGGAEFAPPDRVDLPDHEPGSLLGLADGEPQLDQQDPAAGEHPLETRVCRMNSSY